MSDERDDELEERRALIREVRQRFESLGRAGLVHILAGAKPDPGAPMNSGPRARSVVEPSEVTPTSIEPGPVPGPVTAPAAQETTDHPPRTTDKPARPVPPAKTPTVLPSPRPSLFGDSGFETPPVAAADRPALLATSAAEVAACRRCPHLAATRTQTVFGTGIPTARLMFIGEAPGADEDRTGVPFVGRAGQLLTDMITKGMGLRREEVYIANVIKCRPPDNRTPTPEEAANCSSYLEHQIEVIRPEFLCLLGKTAAGLLDILPTTTMGQLRKRWHSYKGIKTLVTYHPSYLLRNPTAKKDAWEDLQLLMKEMGLPIPRRSR